MSENLNKTILRSLLTNDFWDSILTSDQFKEFVEDNFKIGGSSNIEVVSADELE